MRSWACVHDMTRRQGNGPDEDAPGKTDKIDRMPVELTRQDMAELESARAYLKVGRPADKQEAVPGGKDVQVGTHNALPWVEPSVHGQEGHDRQAGGTASRQKGARKEWPLRGRGSSNM